MTLDEVLAPVEIVTYSYHEGSVNGRTVTKGSHGTIHDACIALTVPYALQAGRPVLTHAVDTIGPRAEYWLHVHPDGQTTQADAGGTLNTSGVTPHGPASSWAAERAVRPVTLIPGSPAVQAGPDAAPPPVPAVPPTLNDLLGTRPAPASGAAQQGWRATVHRLTGGLVTLPPSRAETNRRRTIAAVQRSLAGPKTIAVINPKGGANKTTATLLIAATFGIHRGGYTLAWDNNETRGTMGWRALPGRHTNTAVHLLRELDRFDDTRATRVGDLDNFVRSQGDAQFDVLASDEDATSAASIDAEAFRALHHSLSRFYRVIVVDTGNNMRASNWAAAVDAADQIVIVSTIREDTSQSAAWVADALNEKGFGDKVAQAVTILAAPTVRPDPALTARLQDHFGRLTRAVVQVPFDPALVSGGPIDISALSSASREAWLQATALIADGL